jgi:hypothetical protein
MKRVKEVKAAPETFIPFISFMVDALTAIIAAACARRTP